MKNILKIYNIILKKNKNEFLKYVYFDIIIIIIIKSKQKKKIKKYNKGFFKYFKLVHDLKIKVLKKIYKDFIKNYYLNKMYGYQRVEKIIK